MLYAKKDDEHWAAVNEAASARNRDLPVHDYSGEGERLNSVFVGASRVYILSSMDPKIEELWERC